MYCKECGKVFETENATVCLNCGVKKGNGKKHCDGCGTEKKSENQDVCLSCGKEFKKGFLPSGGVNSNTNKNKLVLALLWFFAGGLGVHCFYAGRNKRGFLILGLWLAGFITCGITMIVSAVLAIIDLVQIFSNKFEDGNGVRITEWN